MRRPEAIRAAPTAVDRDQDASGGGRGEEHDGVVGKRRPGHEGGDGAGDAAEQGQVAECWVAGLRSVTRRSIGASSS